MKIGLLNLIMCFVIALAISPLIIKGMRKLKFGQNILIYVEQHKTKAGTPTMGGIIFIIASLIGYIFTIINGNNTLATISILSLLFFGTLGFLDDFIKIKFKQNEGLKPYQKIIGQVGLSLIIAIYIYMSNLVGTEMIIPFWNINVSVGFWIIPIVVIFYIAVVNSVNLIDGLDGLCGGVSTIVMLSFAILLFILTNNFDGVYLNEVNNIIIVILGVVGSVLGFLCFNVFPAKIFMGDTGSLALGGFIASIFALTKNYFLIIVMGFLFVLTSLSVIIQVLVYKITKKRVFKMSPLHHHFEAETHESKVTSVYVILTIIINVLAICLSI
ncbi:MAG: phospho-N-acetylmuramoyl-pentapeptide-transferase [Christensenellales bacterium]